MKISNRQQQEIDFLSKYIGYNGEFEPVQEEIEQYILKTVYGKGSSLTLGFSINIENNRLELAKRSLDIVIKEWARDMQEGLLAYWELLEDFDNHPYAVRIVNTIRKNLVPLPSYDGLKEFAVLGYLNSKFYLKNGNNF